MPKRAAIRRRGQAERMFDTYRFDHSETDESRILDGRAYLWAALFGPAYVLLKGFVGLSLAMLLISAGIAIASAGSIIIAVGLFDSLEITTFALFAIPVMALAAQGVAAVKLVRFGYLRSGWRESY
jgi:hypothetical protein